MATELKLVPTVATAAMLEAGQRAWLGDTLRKSSTLYAAMVAAAPTAKLGPAFAVSRVGEATKYGGTTYTIKAHFHTRDQAEVARRLLEEQALPPGPFPAQFAEQAELIDTDKLHRALVCMGCSCPSREMLSWWVGREVNHLLDALLNTDGVQPHAPTEQKGGA